MCQKFHSRDFPGGPVIKTPHFHCSGQGSIPGLGTKILYATGGRNQKKRKKNSIAEQVCVGVGGGNEDYVYMNFFV